MSSGWNFADVWETIAEQIPDEQAVVAHGVRRTWAEFDARADGIALTLLEAGAERQDKVAQYLYNGNEYLECLFGAFKAGLAPVNTNYRYVDDELVYLWDNADVTAVAFHGCFAERVEAVRARVPRVTTWLWVDDGSGPCPDWAIRFEDAATSAKGTRVTPPWERTGDDLYLLYTGGTTGMPKGVMWRQDDLYSSFSAALFHDPPAPDLDAVRARVTSAGRVHTSACPLMHGTGAFTAFQTLCEGGSVASLRNQKFDPAELLDHVQAERVNTVAIVGDAFAKPILRALDAEPGRWDLSSVLAIISSGVMWSQQTKEGLLRHHPAMLLFDAFGSSEALGMGTSISSAGAPGQTAKFSIDDNVRVIADDGRFVEPGSGEVGRVGVTGHQPIGYYKDEAKSDATFIVAADGRRYSVPGDYATVEADGTITLLGRGSQCINTGGEKVFPEEVEEAIKELDAVRDAVVVGVPDDKWGEAIVGMVEPAPGADLDTVDVIGHVKQRLAAYKAPKHVLAVATIGRAANGKVDYKRLRAEAVERLGAGSG
jgi:3-oxocholest-4-en-26-oate---CoA ligase